MKWAATVTVLIALAPLAAGFFYALGDTRDVFIPLEIFYRQEQLAGRLPTWMPNAGWGFPVLASAQLGFFYPPLLLTRWLPITVYLPLNLAAHLVATALGTYLFLKRQERSSQAAFLGAISFTLSAFMFQHLTHLNIIFAIAWFPWQILLAQNISERSRVSAAGGAPGAPRQTRNSSEHLVGVQEQTGPAAAWNQNLMWLAVTQAIPFLAGQIQIPLLMALVTSVYYLFHAPHKLRAIRTLGVVAILAMGLAAIQLLPTAELAWYSTRGADSDFDLERANQYSWPPYHMPTLIFPRFFGSQETYWGKRLEVEQGFFIGTIPLLLALYSLRVLRHPSVRFFKWLVVISFLLALGSLSPVRLLGLEPSLWFFSAPARWLLFTTFGLSILAAWGWDKALENELRVRKYAMKAGIPLFCVVILFNLALFIIPDSVVIDLTRTTSDYTVQKIHSLLASARASSASLLSPYTAIPLIILAATPYLIRRRYGQQVLLLVTAAELVVFAATSNPPISWKQTLTPPGTVSRLPANVRNRAARIVTLRDFEDTGKFLTNPAGRTHYRLREEPRQLLLPLIHTQFNLAGIAWPASLDISRNANALTDIQTNLRRDDRTLAEETNVGAVIQQLNQSLKVVDVHPKPRASVTYADGQEVPATYREITPRHIQISVNTERAGTLIVRDTFYPGWRAVLDPKPNVKSGTPVAITPIGPYGMFRSISIPAGRHTIEMQYQPPLLTIGLVISAACVAFIGFTVFRSRFKLTT